LVPGCARLALEIGIHAGHDPQHGGLAGAVDAEQADLGAGEEAERDVLDDLPLRRDHLADTVHGEDVLRAHATSESGHRAAGRAATEREFVKPHIIRDERSECLFVLTKRHSDRGVALGWLQTRGSATLSG
jgi:hypothetical protein